MNLTDQFDAVVMLTWSDWENEPRSNRYHYALRFSRTLPVLFFQHRYLKRDGILVKQSELDGLDLVDVSCGLVERDIEEILQLFSARGIKRPLVWIYDSINYQALIDSLPKAFKVYHATEDYLTETKGWNQCMALTAESIINVIPSIDFMVFVSQGIVDAYYRRGGFKGPGVVIENGCDAEYFIERAERHSLPDPSAKTPIAIFQGGINQRLDYELTLELIQRMPDWEFRFCGAAAESAGWSRVLEQPNVRYFGALPPDEFTRHMCEATVGIITYIQDQWIRNSLPLKSYEYIACGLPVVTVPITALERETELMAMATTAAEFEAAIRRVAVTRYDPVMLRKRHDVALANSYNSRFATMTQRLLEAKTALVHSRKKLNVAMLYDCMISMHVSTIREHLEAFDRYSHHAVTYIPATSEFWKRPAEEVLGLVDFSIFDAVFIHYSTRMSVSSHLNEGLAQALGKYHGLKVLFIQDEYEGTEIARSWMDRLKFDVVYTCVPREGLEQVYPSYRFPATEFLPTLTGYVPEDPALEGYAKPLTERKLLLAYRGRKLPAVYGELGYEKYRIGVDMKIVAGMRGLPVDIEVDDAKRIYGSAWYEFLGSARATLGTESGANVFDFDGSLKKEVARLIDNDPEITFKEISSKVLASHEGRVRMNQISPKIFEAIRLRTALVLFEGYYSGVVQPNLHYVPLKKDFSNIDEVLTKIQNDNFVRDLTQRAYDDIVASGKFSYRTFVDGIDADIERRVIARRTPGTLISPLLLVSEDGSLKHVLPALPVGIAHGVHPLGCPMSLKEITRFLPVEDMSGACISSAQDVAGDRSTSLRVYRLARWVWHRLPSSGQRSVIHAAGWVLKHRNTAQNKNSVLSRIANRAVHIFPSFVRIRLARFIECS